MGILGVNGNNGHFKRLSVSGELKLICYGIGGRFPVRCDAVNVTAERRDSIG